MSKSNLLVVDSLDKARKIQSLLGDEWVVISVGHIQEFPEDEIGIDLRTMSVSYVNGKHGDATGHRILRSAKKSSRIFLAFDPIGVGEETSKYLRDCLVSGGVNEESIHQISFDAITPEGLQIGIKDPRDINRSLADSQCTRRMVDRLVEYQVSSIIRKDFGVATLLVGRIQSVALMLLVEQERKRRDFVSTRRWRVAIDLENGLHAYSRVLDSIGVANRYCQNLLDGYFLTGLSSKKVERKPPPPCNTVSLIQECASKWGLTSEQTMQSLGQLFIDGRITHYQTDSTELPTSFIKMAGEYIVATYGRKYRQTQHAFESTEGNAIRPTRMDPPKKGLKVIKKTVNHQEHVYEVIWRRSVGSQMVPAQITEQRVQYIHATPDPVTGEAIKSNRILSEVFGGCIDFDGWYILSGQPPMKKLTSRGCAVRSVIVEEMWTQPSKHMTECELIEKLEKSGVGRPYNYASIMQFLRHYNYIQGPVSALEPTVRGELLIVYLERCFAHLTQVEFAARMETNLDRIADGSRDSRNYLKSYQRKILGVDLEGAQCKTDVFGSEMPQCDCKRTTTTTYCLVVGRNGPPYFECPVCKNMLGLDFDSSGHIIPFKSVKLPGNCSNCGTGNLSTAMNKHGKYVVCTVCGTHNQDRLLEP